MQSVSLIILQRLALGLLTLLVVSIVIFLAVELLPGDFAEAILGQGATTEAIASIRDQLGLDKPLVQRYLGWLGNAVQGDFGVSFARLNFATNFGSSTNTSIITVADQIKPRFINTLFLAGVAAAIAVPLSLTIGILAALFRNSVFDRVSNVLTLTSISSPEFFVAYILILFLAVLNPWLPSLSNIYETMEFGARLKATLLPALVLTLVVTCLLYTSDAADE